MDGECVEVGGIQVEVISTPGHTPGGVTLKAGDILCPGDTLFRSSIGRTDPDGGNFGLLLQSLKKLSKLEGNYHVCPGHEGLSTLDDERKYNGYLAQAMQM